MPRKSAMKTFDVGFEPTQDLRSPSKEQVRFRKRSQKYDSFRTVKPGQVGKLHYQTYEPRLVHFNSAFGESYTFHDKHYTVLPDETTPQIMTQRMLFKAAKQSKEASRWVGCTCCDTKKGLFMNGKRTGALKAREPLVKNSDGYEEYQFDVDVDRGLYHCFTCDCWDDYTEHNLADCDRFLAEGFVNAPAGAYLGPEDVTLEEYKDWAWYSDNGHVLWNEEGKWFYDYELGSDLVGPLDKAQQQWETKRWRQIEKGWTTVAESEVDDERMVILDFDDADWGFADDWEAVVR